MKIKPEQLEPKSPEWRIALREAIKKLVENENKLQPVDDCLMTHLLKQQGFKGATLYFVNRIRRESGIPKYGERQVGKLLSKGGVK